jgi:hypothetical protein
MALSQATLSGLIKTNIETNMGRSAEDSAQLVKICDAIAKAVVDHIKAAAVVSVTTPNAQGGVATLPGTGTIT